jgi:aldose 1-epimerase
MLSAAFCVTHEHAGYRAERAAGEVGVAVRQRISMLQADMTQQSFGRTPDGDEIAIYEIANASGAAARILSYGGIVQSLRVPDRDGAPGDVVLGGADLAFYWRRHPYFGCITGRVAGRITGGKFQLGGRDYALAVNNPPNHLHGGACGLDRRVWRAEPDGDDTLVLRYRSPDGEEGYPGNVDFTVTYRLTERNELVITSEAAADAPTPVSLTNHSYFNLAGEGSGPVDDHRLQILADEYVPTDGNLTLSGQRRPVAGEAADLREPARFANFVPRLHLQHGDNYLLKPGGGEVSVVARVQEPRSGRTMEVRTDEACLQFYTGAFLDGSFTGKSGVPYTRYHGLCLECHGYPDGVLHPDLGDIIVHPGQPRRRTTVYAFGLAAG